MDLEIVLVSTGMELIFFVVSGMVSCCGFKRKNNLDSTVMFQSLLSSAVQRQGHVSFSAAYPASERVEGAQFAPPDRTRTADLNWPKGYFMPYNVF